MRYFVNGLGCCVFMVVVGLVRVGYFFIFCYEYKCGYCKLCFNFKYGYLIRDLLVFGYKRYLKEEFCSKMRLVVRVDVVDN